MYSKHTMAALLCLQDRLLACREFPSAASLYLRALTVRDLLIQLFSNIAVLLWGCELCANLSQSPGPLRAPSPSSGAPSSRAIPDRFYSISSNSIHYAHVRLLLAILAILRDISSLDKAERVEVRLWPSRARREDQDLHDQPRKTPAHWHPDWNRSASRPTDGPAGPIQPWMCEGPKHGVLILSDTGHDTPPHRLAGKTPCICSHPFAVCGRPMGHSVWSRPDPAEAKVEDMLPPVEVEDMLPPLEVGDMLPPLETASWGMKAPWLCKSWS